MFQLLNFYTCCQTSVDSSSHTYIYPPCCTHDLARMHGCGTTGTLPDTLANTLDGSFRRSHTETQRRRHSLVIQYVDPITRTPMQPSTLMRPRCAAMPLCHCLCRLCCCAPPTRTEQPITFAAAPLSLALDCGATHLLVVSFKTLFRKWPMCSWPFAYGGPSCRMNSPPAPPEEAEAARCSR